MHLRQGTAATLLAACFVPLSAQGQVFTLTQEQMIKYTAQNPYERFPDGRPKVPDELLAKVRGLSAADAGIARNRCQNQSVDSMANRPPGKDLVAQPLLQFSHGFCADVAEEGAVVRLQGISRLKEGQRTADTARIAVDTAPAVQVDVPIGEPNQMGPSCHAHRDCDCRLDAAKLEFRGCPLALRAVHGGRGDVEQRAHAVPSGKLGGLMKST